MNASERNSNIDALITLSAKSLLDEDLEMMRSADEDDIEVPPRVHRKILRRIRNYDKKAEMPKAYIYARRIVAVFLIVCTISFAFCLSVEAIRTEIWNTVVEWYEKYVEIHFETDEPVPTVIEEYREPALQLAGTEKMVVSQTDYYFAILYLKNDKLNNKDTDIVVVYEQSVVNEGSVLQMDNEDCNISEIEINGYSATLFKYNDGKTNLYWLDSEYLYVLQSFDSSIGTDILINIAESIK